MARVNWLDEELDLPLIDEQVEKLESFANAMADGVVTKDELEKQQETLLDAMREVEGSLNDEQHAGVTRLLIELSAYNIMRLLNELQSQRLRRAFDHN
ncbi:MAG: hypothetical protein ACKV22_24145 [Bryobacteraceae bacterium]